MNKLIYMLILLLTMSACASPLIVNKSTSQDIIPGRPGVEKSTIYSFSISNNNSKTMEITNVIVYIDNQYYNLPFDLLNDDNQTVENISPHSNIKVKAKYSQLKAEKFNSDKKVAALIYYKLGKKIKTNLVTKIEKLEAKRLR